MAGFFLNTLSRLVPRTLSSRFDALRDPYSGRGSSSDKTQGMRGNYLIYSSNELLNFYKSNGFAQTIAEQPAKDSVREWFDLTTNRDDLDISRKIQNRLEELDVRTKLYDLVRFSRIFSRGGFMYYGVLADKPQVDAEIEQPLPIANLRKIDFLNVITNPDNITVLIDNISDPLAKSYNQPRFNIMGRSVHRSRISWLVKNFDPEVKEGLSVIQTIRDAIVAQDSALWSASNLVGDMATKVFKSGLLVGLSPEKQAEVLAKLVHVMNTQSAIALAPDESYEKQIYTMTGLKDIFDFIVEMLSGVARMPKNILLGKGQGVVTQGEYDTLNYYAGVAQDQELELRKILNKIIKLIVYEKDGAVYRALGGNCNELDWNLVFNPLWRLDPVSQADVELKRAQRDQIDVTIGKADPNEVRELDERFAKLEDFIETPSGTSLDRKAIINYDLPKPPPIGEGVKGKSVLVGQG